MQEYCLPTDVRDDVRDFTKMMKNKVRRSRSRIGYLPVDQILEGPPLEQTDTAPRNPESESIHQRLQLLANRIGQHEKDTMEIVPGNTEKVSFTDKPRTKDFDKTQRRDSDYRRGPEGPGIKSPSSLISQVEQMRKEELDQLLQKLKYENM
jgi:hypothetical protein